MIHIPAAPSGVRVGVSRVPAGTSIDNTDDDRFFRIVTGVAAINGVAVVVREDSRTTSHFVAAAARSVVFVVLVRDCHNVPTCAAMRVQVTVTATATMRLTRSTKGVKGAENLLMDAVEESCTTCAIVGGDVKESQGIQQCNNRPHLS